MISHTSGKFVTVADSSPMRPSALTLNGMPVIEHFSCEGYYGGATYSEENRLLVTMQGDLSLSYGNSKCMLGEHQMAFLKGGTRIEYQTIKCIKEEYKTEFIIFSIGYDLMKEFSTIAQLSFEPKIYTDSVVISDLCPNILKFTNSLISYLEDAVIMDDTLVKIKLLELLYSLKANNKSILNLFLDLRKDFRPKITVVVENNITNPLSVSQLARLAGRSLSSFRRDFMSVYNMPPSQWIRERRLKKSREFLLNTNMTVTDICYTLGFENTAHFSRLFKSQFGHSPREYRMQLLSA